MHNENVVLRKARVEDAEDIATVHVQCWKETYKGILPADYLLGLDTQKRAVSWRRTLEGLGQTSCCLVQQDSAEGICGFVYAGASRDDSSLAEVYAVYVLQAYQKQKLGLELWQAGQQFLKSQGYSSFFVWVLAENKCGLEFYGKAKGKLIGERDIELGGQQLRELQLQWTL